MHISATSSGVLLRKLKTSRDLIFSNERSFCFVPRSLTANSTVSLRTKYQGGKSAHIRFFQQAILIA